MALTINELVGPFEYANAPFWHNRSQSLYFVDIFKSEVHRYEPSSKQLNSAKVGTRAVSFIIPIEDFDNKYLINYGPDLAAITWDGRSNQVASIKIIETVDFNAGNRLSDGKVSPEGVLFMGSSGPWSTATDVQLNKAGLYSFSECTIKKILADVSSANGMAWDGANFFFVDWPEYRVERYCYREGYNEISLEQAEILSLKLEKFTDIKVYYHRNDFRITPSPFIHGFWRSGKLARHVCQGRQICLIQPPTAFRINRGANFVSLIALGHLPVNRQYFTDEQQQYIQIPQTHGCILYEFKDDNTPGFPSGMTIDNNGHLWVGCFNGGQVIKIEPKTGKSTFKIEIPQSPQITSMTFGGRNMSEMFVTSASFNMDTVTKSANPFAGYIFVINGLEVSGPENVPMKLIK